MQDLGAQPLPLDVRNPQQVQQAADTVSASELGLHAVVHNAGVGGIGLMAGWPDEDVQSLVDTNVFGPHRIGSQGGSITSPIMGPYTMCKHAREVYASCLRQELAPHGVAVSIVQPGAVATDIGDKGRAGNIVRLRATPPPFDTASAAALAGLLNPTPPDVDQPESGSSRRYAPPEKVAAVVMQPLFGPDPQARYLVGTTWKGDRVIRELTQRPQAVIRCRSDRSFQPRRSPRIWAAA